MDESLRPNAKIVLIAVVPQGFNDKHEVRGKGAMTKHETRVQWQARSEGATTNTRQGYLDKHAAPRA
jgi:hypothetical protein